MRSSCFFALGLAAMPAAAARPASACRVDKFQIVGGLDSSGNVVAGQRVDFQAVFENPVKGSVVQRGVQIGSLRMDFGDGTVEDTGVKTFDPPSQWDFGAASAAAFSHHYGKGGAYTASLKGGGVQPCATTAGMSYRITVVGNLTAGKNTNQFPQASSSRQHKNSDGTAKKIVYVPPTPVSYVAVGKDSGASHEFRAVIPGQIHGATVISSFLGNILSVDGTGRCGLKAFETMDGSALKTYDYKGPLPTRITLLNTRPGIHVVRIEGDKSSDSCGGTASASVGLAKK